LYHLALFICHIISTVPLSLSSLTLFLYSHPPHRDLHSFPTRRSSDLSTWAKALSRPPSASVIRPWSSMAMISSSQPRTLHTRSIDRKSTRLNSSHRTISYAVFCLKKKKNKIQYLPNITTLHLPHLLFS